MINSYEGTTNGIKMVESNREIEGTRFSVRKGSTKEMTYDLRPAKGPEMETCYFPRTNRYAV